MYSYVVEMVNQPDWYQAARRIIAQGQLSLPNQDPPGVAVSVEWKNQPYIGSIQQIAPEFSDEIVLLNKSTNPIPEGLNRAINELDKDRLRLSVDPAVDLEDRLNVLRRVGDQLQYLTADQFRYIERRPISVIEDDEVITKTKSHRYMEPEDMGPRRN